MEAKIINLDRTDTPKGLNEIITKIVEVIEVERIYLSKGASHHSFIYRVNIILKLSQKDNIGDIRPVVNLIFKQHPDFCYCVFAFNYVCNQIEQGNLYFLNNCHERDLVYKTTNDNSIWNYPIGEPTKLIEKIKQDFKRDMSRMKSFKKGVHYFKTEKNLSQSAFMMHQTFEQSYRILERFICGKIKICHSIKNHQTYVLKSLNELESMFLVESDAEIRLLDLLEEAYSSARYTHNYKITEKQLDQLSQKLGLFIKEIKWLFNEELIVFEETKIKDKSEQTTEKSIKDSELDYHVREFRFYDSFEMLCKARSMMLLSVTCLQTDVQPPMNVNCFHEEIREVLEFAIELLPLKEISS
tara:strand:- start:10246 stop:11313 length:1068 start_codon:yes stop_codon:yes gene_type:complete